MRRNKEKRKRHIRKEKENFYKKLFKKIRINKVIQM